MRESMGKYRGKRLDNGEWAYGYYSVYTCPEYGTIDHEIHDGGDIVDVDPDTVEICICDRWMCHSELEEIIRIHIKSN